MYATLHLDLLNIPIKFHEDIYNGYLLSYGAYKIFLQYQMGITRKIRKGCMRHIVLTYVGHPMRSNNGLISQKLLLKSEFYYPLHVAMGVA